MAFDKKLKADTIIFEMYKSIPAGNELMLKPIVPDTIDSEAFFYKLNTHNEGVKKYLPSVYVESEEEAKKKLLDFITRQLLRGTLFYCIHLTPKPLPVGYIHFSTPFTATGLDGWSVE